MFVYYSSMGTILSCIKSLITKCLYEPQVLTLYGSAVEGFEAAFECICAPEHFGKSYQFNVSLTFIRTP